MCYSKKITWSSILISKLTFIISGSYKRHEISLRTPVHTIEMVVNGFIVSTNTVKNQNRGCDNEMFDKMKSSTKEQLT